MGLWAFKFGPKYHHWKIQTFVQLKPSIGSNRKKSQFGPKPNSMNLTYPFLKIHLSLTPQAYLPFPLLTQTTPSFMRNPTSTLPQTTHDTYSSFCEEFKYNLGFLFTKAWSPTQISLQNLVLSPLRTFVLTISSNHFKLQHPPQILHKSLRQNEACWVASSLLSLFHLPYFVTNTSLCTPPFSLKNPIST